MQKPDLGKEKPVTRARQNVHSHERGPDTIYGDIARLRFPSWEITGIGPLALILECS